MTPQKVSQDTRTELIDYFGSVLRVPPQKIDTSVHILELGLDSIMLIEAQRWLKARFGCSIEVHRFFEELNTLDRIAAYVAAERQAIPFTSDSDPKHDLQATAAIAEKVAQQEPSSLSSGYGLMQAQLAMVADVIEAQNRVLIKRADAPSHGA